MNTDHKDALVPLHVYRVDEAVFDIGIAPGSLSSRFPMATG